MLSAFTKKNKIKQRSSSQKSRTNSKTRISLKIMDPCERSTVVKFRSDQPTQIWQASPSPSPTPSEIARCQKEMVNFAQARWNTRITNQDDSTDDSSYSDQESRAIEAQNSSSSTSTSSLDEGMIAEQERRRLRKRKSQKHKNAHSQQIIVCQNYPVPILVNSITKSNNSRRRSTSTSSTSSNESNSEDKNMQWTLNTGSLPLHSSQAPLILPITQQQPMASTNNGTPQVVYHPSFGHKLLQTPKNQFSERHVFMNHQYNSPVVSTMRKQPIGASNNNYIYSPAIKRIVPQEVANFESPMTPIRIRTNSVDNLFGKIVRITSDYLPTHEWQTQYKVMSVRKGDLVQIDRQPPKTSKEEVIGANSWLMVKRWCPNHHSSTGPTGFVPRHLCQLLTNIEPRYESTSNIYNIGNNGMVTAAEPYSTPMLPKYNPGLELNTPIKNLNGPSSSNSQDTVQVSVFGSGASLTYGSEHEDRDSGRGPSSGSEWSSAGCKTSRDSALGLEAALDDLEQINARLANWNDNENQGWLAESLSVNDSPPTLPPPMEPLKDPLLLDRIAAIGLSSPEANLPSPPSWIKSDQASDCTPEVNRNPLKYKPYKTMIKVNDHTLEKLTLV